MLDKEVPGEDALRISGHKPRLAARSRGRERRRLNGPPVLMRFTIFGQYSLTKKLHRAIPYIERPERHGVSK